MAAPVQRGTQHDTVTAPTSSVYTIDADTFEETDFADQESVKNEAASDIAEVFQNPGKRVSFKGTLKSGQTALRSGDLLALTFSGGTVVTYVVESGPTKGGFGKTTRQQITAKKADSETF